MATQNAINQESKPLSSTAVTIDPGVSGDSYVQFDINTTGEFRIGVDDDDADKFKISQGSALGTNDTFIMTANGERTMPLQPACLAYLSSDDTNVTGAGTLAQLGSGTALTEVFDQNADFNTNGTFTAPVTGRYLLIASLRMEQLAAGMISGQMQLVTSNRTYFSNIRDALAVANSSSQTGFAISAIADMDASDTATANILVAGGGGDTADISGGASPLSYFCGYLVA